MSKKVRWFVRYRCGCSDDAPRKKDLLEYCGKHGDNAVEWIKMPAKSSTTPSEKDSPTKTSEEGE